MKKIDRKRLERILEFANILEIGEEDIERLLMNYTIQPDQKTDEFENFMQVKSLTRLGIQFRTILSDAVKKQILNVDVMNSLSEDYVKILQGITLATPKSDWTCKLYFNVKPLNDLYSLLIADIFALFLCGNSKVFKNTRICPQCSHFFISASKRGVFCRNRCAALWTYHFKKGLSKKKAKVKP